MSPGLSIPPIGTDHTPDSVMDSTRYVLKFLSEILVGYNGEIPLTGDANFGLSLILDCLIEGLDKAQDRQ